MKKLIITFSILLSFLSGDTKNKIVSIGGSITETIVALGHEKDLIAVDLTSMHPKSVKKLPNIGYWLQVSKEGILSLRPSLVIASEKSKPKEVLSSLKSFGIKTHLIDDKPSFDSAIKKVEQIGKILNEKEKATKIINRIKSNIKKVEKEVKQTNKKVLFLFSRGTDKVMGVGKNTDIDVLITKSGAKNVANFKNFRIITKESIAKINPDVLIIGDIDGARYDVNNLHDNSLKVTNAYKNKQIYTIDMLMASGFSVRVDEALFKMSCIINKNKLSFCKE